MKTKRTDNISSEAVATVRRLVEGRHMTLTQDALTARLSIRES